MLFVVVTVTVALRISGFFMYKASVKISDTGEAREDDEVLMNCCRLYTPYSTSARAVVTKHGTTRTIIDRPSRLLSLRIRDSRHSRSNAS